MEKDPEALEKEALAKIDACLTAEGLEELRISYLGKKGAITQLLTGLRALPAELRREVGLQVNLVKQSVQRRLEQKKKDLSELESERRLQQERVDVTLPGTRSHRGRAHPIPLVMEEIIDIFVRMGFSVAEGPDIEDDYHNFEALNIPLDHPAREMQDTFFIRPGVLLRTHTSPVQIRVMNKAKPPMSVIAPGAVYRHDDDVTHSPMFHQVEGFMVDREISFGDLKGVLTHFLGEIFTPKTLVRFRPSYFPFTEPSAEVDIQCQICKGQGCRVCKQSGWLEILGAGMIHRNVFLSVGYNPQEVTGFAFGVGVERVAMLKFGIDDIRLFFENDLRFLRQFR
jgi:phenylalanyl-tRNA synthetase alpha chain